MPHRSIGVKSYVKLLVTGMFAVFGLVALIVPANVTAAPGLEKFEQHITIANGEYTTTSATATPTNNSLGLIYFDSADYDGDTVYFEAILRCTSCSSGNQRAQASLYTASGTLITTISTTSSSNTVVRSGSLSLTAGEYTVRFNRDAGDGNAYLKAARLVIAQENRTVGITATQTQVEVGHNESSTATTFTQLAAPKFFVYDHSKYSGTVTAYFEATLRSANTTTTDTTGYYDSYDAGEVFSSNPSNMTDNNTTTYASTSTDGDSQLLTGNTYATDLGAITKVEIRAFARKNSENHGNLTLRPVFSGTTEGDDYSITPGTSGAYSDYQDITSGTNAPSQWSWQDVEDLDLRVIWNTNDGVTGEVARVQFRITYYPKDRQASVELYNTTNSTSVAVVTNETPEYLRVRSAALSSNWDTANPDQYVVRIKTDDENYEASIQNAKIIVEQSQGSGITAIAIPYQLITTDRNQNNTNYVQESFHFDFDPQSFIAPHTWRVFHEATLKTSAGTGYAMMYNQTDADTIDAPTTSELTTSSTSFERQISADISGNTDWPTAAKTLDSILKTNSGSNTVTVSSSRLIFELQNLDPSFSLEVAGVSAGLLINGITTTNATTITGIDFGRITAGQPYFAAQSLAIDVNDAVQSYAVTTRLAGQFQGLYPANHIDPFVGGSATWSSPQTWSEPTGTTKNTNTAWFGANTTDTTVSGWSSGSGKFGPISTTDTTVALAEAGASKTVFVTYGLEVNMAHPADLYSGTILYTATPIF